MNDGRENQIETPECPDIELLSAWFDGEENLTEAQKEHIKTCKSCAKRLADYKGICTGMKKEFTCQELNTEMTERILSQTRCMIRKQIDTVKLEKQAKMRNRIIWGIRIGLLLLAIVFFILLMMREKKQKHAAAASAHTQSLAIRGPGYTTFKVPKKLRTYQTSDVFSSSASNVELTLDSGMFCVLEGETVFLPEVPVYIPSNLTQYWSCTSFSANRLSDHVADLKKNLNVKKLDVKKNDTQKNFSVEMIFNGNARQFAVFIKQLRAWGLTQLDVAQPRGERFFFSGDGETIVNCRFFVFIPEDGGKYILPVK